MTQRALLVINPTAGGGRAVAAAPIVQDVLRSHGWVVRAIRSRNSDEATRIAAEADSDEVVASLGGDGMHALVARGAVISGARFAPLPGGRGNDFVRAVGAPRDPAAAAAALRVAHERRIDLGEVNGAPFLGVVSIGFSALASQIAARSRIPGPLAYHTAAVRTMARVSPFQFDVTIDNRTIHWSGYELAIGMSGWYGGGLNICPQARLDDGLVDLTFVATRKRGFAQVMARAFHGTHIDMPGVATDQGSLVEVQDVSDGPSLVYADGDPVGTLPVAVRVRPAALRLLA
ncbi:Diacylglycerol kinase [Austwickia sp. TVS 96-490-7B]|uniref:diacylglycerol/lipid kinase family protein n=1 Tax=Austwickia sp. TVS 96-490-7B TaxID=2830843 RepID=UPI001C574940|nr:diacylglycerol kinase family protein [Austwickia sp. TVS 96-490-7B]MBW3085482.1 Diacylglycerol kinase [Austwickia sp. TVS 96-490-7B]